MLPLKSRIVEKLLKGEFVTIGDLLRMKRVPPTTSSKQIARVGNISLSLDADATAAATAAKRTVSMPLDFLEAFTASVMPAQLHRLTTAAAAPADSELAVQLERMRQLVVFLATSVCYFRKYSRLGSHGHIISFLEQQRQGWHDQRHDLATPDATAFMAMTAAASPPTAGSYTGAAASSSATGDAPPRSSQQRSFNSSAAPTVGGKPICMLYNRGNCTFGTKCKYVHACSRCKTEGHTQNKCTGLVSPPSS